MKQYFDFLPAILFFVGFKLADIFVATGVAMGASIILIAWALFRREPVRPIQWISLGFIAVVGSLTVLLHDEYYIKIKGRMFYALMGMAIFVSVALKKNSRKSLMSQS